MHVAHVLTAGIANVVILFANQNVTKFEHEMNTEYENKYQFNQANLLIYWAF
jgi:hypothetical protein